VFFLLLLLLLLVFILLVWDLGHWGFVDLGCGHGVTGLLVALTFDLWYEFDSLILERDVCWGFAAVRARRRI